MSTLILVIPTQAGIQVTDSARHTVEKRYPGGCWVWMPGYTGMTEFRCAESMP